MNRCTSVMSTYNDEEKVRARQDALAYAEGDEVKVNAGAFQVRNKSRNVGINDWSTIDFPPAEKAKRKERNVAKELLNSEVRDQYISSFCLQPPSDGLGSSAVKDENEFSKAATPETVPLQSLDSANPDAAWRAASGDATETEYGYVRESAKNADQRAMFFLAALIAMLAFLINHNAPAGWFKSIAQWSFADFVGFASMIGLAVAASAMLAVLYPVPQGDSEHERVPDRLKHFSDLSKLCAVKYRNLRYGFWIGAVAAFLSLLFLILSKKPHLVNYRKHFY